MEVFANAMPVIVIIFIVVVKKTFLTLPGSREPVTAVTRLPAKGDVLAEIAVTTWVGSYLVELELTRWLLCQCYTLVWLYQKTGRAARLVCTR